MSFVKPGLPSASRYKFIINQELAKKDGYFGGDFKYEDLLLAMGPDVKTHTDVSKIAKNFYSPYSQTLSKDLNPFYEKIAASGGMKDIDTNSIRWKVHGKPERTMVSYGNPNPVGAKVLGLAGFPFKIRLDREYLRPGDIVANVKNKTYGLVIQSTAIRVGGAYEYEVVTEQANGTFPAEYLKAGDYWIKRGAITSHLESGQAGSIEFGMSYSWVEFEIKLTTMQWEYSVDEETHLKFGNLVIDRCDSNYKPLPGGRSVTNFLETEAVNQIRKEKELYMIYGRSSSHHVDKITGKQITTSPGLMEWFEQGQEIKYATTLNGLDQVVADIQVLWYDTIPINQRELTLLGGEAFLGLFHDWIENKYGQTAVISSEDLILGTSTPFEAGRNGRSFGKLQFTKYYVPTFGSISVAHWSLLDNTRVNGVRMPGSHFPVSSFEAYAFDFGFGEPNIELYSRKDKERSVYIPGMWSPFGKVGMDNPHFKQPSDPNHDGYKWRHRCSFGLVVHEPDRMLRIMPNVAW